MRAENENTWLKTHVKRCDRWKARVLRLQPGAYDLRGMRMELGPLTHPILLVYFRDGGEEIGRISRFGSSNQTPELQDYRLATHSPLQEGS